MDRELPDGFVYMVGWRCNATSEDGQFTTVSHNTVGFQGSPSDPGFIPFDELTEEEVLEWVWASPSGYIDPDPDSGEKEPTTKELAEALLARTLDTMQHPTTASGLPWV